MNLEKSGADLMEVMAVMEEASLSGVNRVSNFFKECSHIVVTYN